MAVSDATWLDQQGRIRLVGQLSGDFGGLPTGWTQDASDPSNVSSNDGSLDLGAGELDCTDAFVNGDLRVTGSLTQVGDVGFYNTAPIAQQTGVAVTAAGIHAALVNLGLITA